MRGSDGRAERCEPRAANCPSSSPSPPRRRRGEAKQTSADQSAESRWRDSVGPSGGLADTARTVTAQPRIVRREEIDPVPLLDTPLCVAAPLAEESGGDAAHVRGLPPFQVEQALLLHQAEGIA